MSTSPDVPTASNAQVVDPHMVAEHKKYFTFFNLSLALVFITMVEIVIIYLPMNQAFIFTSLVVLSLLKFVGVIWWFMHLRWDKALLTILFVIGLFLATGTVTALMFLFETAPGGVPASPF